MPSRADRIAEPAREPLEDAIDARRSDASPTERRADSSSAEATDAASRALGAPSRATSERDEEGGGVHRCHTELAQKEASTLPREVGRTSMTGARTTDVDVGVPICRAGSTHTRTGGSGGGGGLCMRRRRKGNAPQAYLWSALQRLDRDKLIRDNDIAALGSAWSVERAHARGRGPRSCCSVYPARGRGAARLALLLLMRDPASVQHRGALHLPPKHACFVRDGGSLHGIN
jgi:hypothetical protein